MHFVLLGKTHVRLEAISAFAWDEGTLFVFFIGEKKPDRWSDPDREKYNYLCDQIRDIAYNQR